MKIQTAIIGYGYWGKNLARNFFNNPKCNLKSVADVDPNKLSQLQKMYPTVRGTLSSEDIILSSDINAVSIATPVMSHFTLAKQALESDKHVLLEKPMTCSLKEAEELAEIALKRNKVLMIDHTFLYTSAVQKMQALIDSNNLGKIKYIDSTRINLGIFQQDVNVLWDLASHDISIVNYLLKDRPVSLQAIGVCHTGNNIENIAYLTLHYNSGLIVHYNCSWSSPVKIRQMFIGGEKKMILYNDIEPTDKIKVYDFGYEIRTEEDKNQFLVDYRRGNISIPKLNTQEALASVVNDFYNAISNGINPVSDAISGVEVVKILEAAQQSIRAKGKEVMLSF